MLNMNEFWQGINILGQDIQNVQESVGNVQQSEQGQENFFTQIQKTIEELGKTIGSLKDQVGGVATNVQAIPGLIGSFAGGILKPPEQLETLPVANPFEKIAGAWSGLLPYAMAAGIFAVAVGVIEQFNPDLAIGIAGITIFSVIMLTEMNGQGLISQFSDFVTTVTSLPKQVGGDQGGQQ